MASTIADQSAWTLDAIPLTSIDVDRVRQHESLFYQVAAASFVETAADLYAHNLVTFFKGDAEIVDWLEKHWEFEEVRHGRALRAYVRHVWPEFDWDAAFAAFFADYSRLCTVEHFEATRALEMVARCVVETGTATYYQALGAQSPEPVLAGIAARIRADEVNHYKHFLRYFHKYEQSEPLGRWRILCALRRRIFEARGEDVEIAVRHAFSFRQPQAELDGPAYEALCEQVRQDVTAHFPLLMAAKMLLKPLHLPGSLTRWLQLPVARLTSAWLLR